MAGLEDIPKDNNDSLARESSASLSVAEILEPSPPATNRDPLASPKPIDEPNSELSHQASAEDVASTKSDWGDQTLGPLLESTLEPSALVTEINLLRSKITEIENRSRKSQKPTHGPGPFDQPHPNVSSFRYALDWYTYNSAEESSDESDAAADYTFQRWRLRREMKRELDREVERLHDRKADIKRFRELKEDRKKSKLERRGSQSKLPTSTEPPKKVSIRTVPQIGFVEWQTFKSRGSMLGGSTDALDVLMGEPEISFSLYRRGRLATSKPRLDTRPKESNRSGKAPLLSGQAPLPERIRINSTGVIQTLLKIHSTSDVSPQVESIVIIRPFKALVYLEKSIREHYKALEHKFTPYTSTDFVQDSLSPSSVESTVNTEVAALNQGEERVIPAGIPVSAKDAWSLDQKKGEGRDEEKGPRKEEAEPSYAPKTELDNNASQDEKEQQLEITEDTDDTKSVATFQDLGCLIKFMDETISAKNDYFRTPGSQKIAFADIWHLFKPGDEVIGRDGKQAYRILSVTSTRHHVIPPFRNYFDKTKEKLEDMPIYLSCVYVDFNGKQLGPVTKNFEMKRFDGERAVASLEVYPLRYHVNRIGQSSQDPKSVEEDVQTFRQTLIDRGRKFLQVAGVHNMYYAGLTLDTRDEVESQVVVDAEEAFLVEANKQWMPSIEQLIGVSLEPTQSSEALRSCTGECCEGDTIYDDAYAEKERNEDYMTSLIPESREKLPSVAIFPRSLQEAKAADNAPTDDDLVIMSYRVFGFILRSRKWAKLDLTYLTEDTTRNNENDADGSEKDQSKTLRPRNAFDDLVLPSGHKEMVLSLIAQHFRDKESATGENEQLDIVRGKGKGLILLLHGAPGVGKTTTAEGVAELFKRPLFQITCGDLGSTAKEVETALETNFALANRWGCILLLDEADVFLAARSRDDFTRNGLVAVFLRVLEYYAGILFLTTNRIGDFDEAFASRIHISLHYPPLDRDSTWKIFELNLGLIKDRFSKKGRRLKIEEVPIGYDAMKYWDNNEHARWNGRQIRNACQTALALAEFEAQGGSHETILDPNAEVTLQAKHFETVSKAYLEFLKYLKEIYGTWGAQRAKEEGIRAIERIQRTAKPRAPDPQAPANRGPSGPFPGAHLYQQSAATMGPPPQNYPVSYQLYSNPSNQAPSFPNTVPGAQNHGPPAMTSSDGQMWGNLQQPNPVWSGQNAAMMYSGNQPETMGQVFDRGTPGSQTDHTMQGH